MVWKSGKMETPVNSEAKNEEQMLSSGNEEEHTEATLCRSMCYQTKLMES